MAAEGPLFFAGRPGRVAPSLLGEGLSDVYLVFFQVSTPEGSLDPAEHERATLW